MKKNIKTLKAPQAIGPYSQAVVVDDFIFISGQIPLLPNGELIKGTIEKETHQVMKNLNAILDASKVSFKDVVKITLYVTDISMFKRVNEVYKSYMSEPYPARETVGVKELPLGAKLEMSMIATKE